MRHYLAILQTGSLYTTCVKNFSQKTKGKLCTPITGTPLYEKYLELAKKNKALPQVQYNETVLVSYSTEKDLAFWDHSDPKDHKVITELALIPLNLLLQRYNTNPRYSDDIMDVLASLHYFLASTLPFERGSSFIAEIVVNASALLFGVGCTWNAELPDCLAFASATPEQYQPQYRAITTILPVGKLNPSHCLPRINPSQRTSLSRKIAIKNAFPPEDSSDDDAIDYTAQHASKKRQRDSHTSYHAGTQRIKKHRMEDIPPTAERRGDWVIFNYDHILKSQFFNTNNTFWGGLCLSKNEGKYDKNTHEIKIQEANLQKFFDDLCNFSKSNSRTVNEKKLATRRNIITRLHEAARTVVPLPNLTFIEEEKNKYPIEVASPTAEYSNGVFFLITTIFMPMILPFIMRMDGEVKLF